ncbi:MAG TPA: hypothetical protein P5556_04375 [Candidatus Gastranaerophilales bacterium]|nr:hypothetical protein [Candidatus Gastranaerophilales bacterium]
MFLAKVKYPYKKEWEKDLGYGLSAPITLENKEIGDYRQYVKANDPEKQWLRSLKKGEEVYIEKNSLGNGFIIKPIQSDSTTEESPKNEASKIKNNAKILIECIKEVELQLQETKTSFTSEDVRSLSISLYIQSMKEKKFNWEYEIVDMLNDKTN